MKTIKQIQDNITKLIEVQREQSTSEDALFIGTAIFGVQLTLIEIRDILESERHAKEMAEQGGGTAGVKLDDVIDLSSDFVK